MGRPACQKPGHTKRPSDGRCLQCLGAARMRHYRASKPKYKARAKAWNKNNPERRRAIMRKHMYGVEPTRPCPDLCECCKRRKATCFDHCHTTGKFRGWLCDGCNKGIGALGDTIDDVINAVGYLAQTC